MLKFYFSTVIIYAICIWATTKIFGDQFRKNMLKITEKEPEKSDVGKYKGLFILSAIPIVRFAIIIIIIWVAVMNDETIERTRENIRANKTKEYENGNRKYQS